MSKYIRGKTKKEFPGLRRKYDNKIRPVTATIMTWVSGEHYYASLKEDENPAYDPKAKTWRSFWDDTKKNAGREFDSGQFWTWQEARDWINREYASRFRPKSKYKLVLGNGARLEYYSR